MTLQKNINLKKNNQQNICEHVTITIPYNSKIKPNKIFFVNYFISFLKVTNLINENISTDSLNMSVKLKGSRAMDFLKYLSIYIFPNQQKFKKYVFNKETNTLSFVINDWVNLIPNNKFTPFLYQQPSMQIVVVLKKSFKDLNAFTSIMATDFPITNK